MLKRLPGLLAAIVYLLAQAGLLAHASELPEICHHCDGAGAELHCGDEDCADGAHHHHHSHAHHPGSCRACGAAAFALIETPSLETLALESPAPADAAVRLRGAGTLLCRPIRAPPAR